MADRSRPARSTRSQAPHRRVDSSRRTPPRRRNRGAGHIIGRVLLWLLVIVLALAIVAVIGLFAFYQRTKLPDPNKDFQTNTTFVYYNDGRTKLGSFSIQNRQSISYQQMPQSIKDAVVSAENRTFWTDSGISPKGMARAAWTILRGGEVQGGSTITQQYIKVLYLNQSRTAQRKLTELVLAEKMGREVSKQSILEGYLNTIYFGRGAYGVQAAAKAYFYEDASKLTVPQSAVLASVLNNPTLYDPSGGKDARERLLNRYRYVLDGMLQMGRITQSVHDQAYRALPTFPDVPINNQWSGTKGYLLHLVQQELVDDGFTDSQINGGGLTVTTTLDVQDQAAAVRVGQKYKKLAGANAGSSKSSQLHPAIASVQVGTGAILALYGGDDYVTNSRNWATTARPAASTFKTYAVIAGMRNGFSLESTLDGDSFTPKGDTTEVRNEFDQQYGTVTLQEATEKSINTAFVDMVSQIGNGPTQVIKAANDAGVPKGQGWDNNNRIALGTAEVSPLDQASGYATIANEGLRVASHIVAKVADSAGKTLYTAKTTGTRTIEQDISHDTTYALESVVSQGTGSAVSDLGYDVAGKTGTSGVGSAITSAWFVAYTKQISTAVMFVAGDAGNADLDPYKRSGDQTFYGGTYPALTWAEYMQTAMKGLKAESFADPDWVNLSGHHYGGSSASATSRTTQSQPTSVETTQAPQSQAPSTQAAPTTSAPQPSVTRTTQTQPAEPTTQQTSTSTRTTTTQTSTTHAAPEPTNAPTGGGQTSSGAGG